jgi:MFS family permease
MYDDAGKIARRRHLCGAWVIASAALAILTISPGAPLLPAVTLQPVAADLDTTRASISAAGSFTYIGVAFGGILAGWLSGRIAIRWIVIFGAVMLAAGLVVSASGGLLALYAVHGVLLGTSRMFSPLVTYREPLVRSPPRGRRRVPGAAAAGNRTAPRGGLMPIG